ncbi:ABC transporter permease [Vibrio sp. 10N.286.49.B3]|uniref:ABC transporter permease n=1 Tax=Vibrio sp. 10N.286.49.B3 TaxID=1880855 RepID=UPI000C81F84D|nr:ABC transporter permease [Vibrio sp. 10N.286.49.B3]PMH46669.1 ABC transporter permease [Vibrio sp. 10N.286.49.B3]
MLWPVIKALLGHYRRYPLQIILVWLGLTLGISLLVGVMAVNKHAQQSYTYGEQLFSNPLPYRIRPKHSANKIPQGFYIQLRRSGFEQCVPFELTNVTTEDGEGFSILGIDPVAMLQLVGNAILTDVQNLNLMKSPYPLLVSKDLANHFKWENGDYLKLRDGTSIGPLYLDQDNKISGTRIISDISLLRQLERGSGLTVIGCGDMPEEKLVKLRELLPNGLQITRSTKLELESLTKAFHLNLTAMGMLAFVVGLFIFYQAMSLSFIQRQPLVGILRQNGVSSWQLAQALCLELMLLIVVSWLCGNVFGLLLANELIPTVSASLGALYDANVGLSVQWSWDWSRYTLLMAIAGVVVACGWPATRLLRAQPIRLSARLSLVRFAGSEFLWQAIMGGAFFIAAIAVYHTPQTQQSGFLIIAFILLSVALIVPFLIWQLFTFFGYSLKWVKARWFFADAAVSMSYRGVAVMAFILALTANIGVETMVGSFRDTTDKWLTQRLAADLYIYPSNHSASNMSQWLEKQPEVDTVWWRWEKELQTPNGAIEVVSSGESQGELHSLTVKVGIPNYWYYLHNSQGIMISESMAIKSNIRPGDRITLGDVSNTQWQVLGVYYDYGNPYHQVMMSHQNWLASYAGAGNVALGVLFDNSDVDTLNFKRRLERVFRINSQRIFDNSNIHNQAMKVFDRTFSVAALLGNITLVIAVFGIFFSTLAGEFSRQRHFALLRCLGVSGKELIITGSLQLLVFSLIAMLVSIPLGLLLARLIVDIIITHSFGWSIDLQVMPWEYLETFLWTISALMLAGALPVLRLIRNTPMKSLRDAL